MAPMEGITRYIYRNAQHTHFGGVDTYFTPFLSPSQHHRFTVRERRDVLPEHNRDMHIVPQLLTNRAEDFIWAARELRQLGYEEINLNLGCPSGTVAAKYKGAGFLAKKEELQHFLDEVFMALDLKISLKTRIGVERPEEFYDLMEIYNRFPLSELIIHPRVRTDFYRNTPNLEIFKDAVRLCKSPVCYNGDLFTSSDYRKFVQEFPSVDRLMLGRGLIANPGLAREMLGGPSVDADHLFRMHQDVYMGYRSEIPEANNVLFKMKELWAYMAYLFEDCRKYVKRIRKARSFTEYEDAVRELFSSCRIMEGAGFAGREMPA